MNHYELLGLSPDAAPETIRQAIGRQSVLVNKRLATAVSLELKREAEDRLELLAEARRCLLDAESRYSYDLANGLMGGLPAPGSGPGALDEPRQACRYCGESIAARARKCRFCNEWLSRWARFARRGVPVLLLVAIVGIGFTMAERPWASKPQVPTPETHSVQLSDRGPSDISVIRGTAKSPTPPGDDGVERHRQAEVTRRQGMTLYTRGEALFYRTGDLAARDDLFWQACAKFREASSLNRNNPEPLFNLAVVLEAMNHREAARGFFAQALSKATDDKWLYIRVKSQNSIRRIDKALSRIKQ